MFFCVFFCFACIAKTSNGEPTKNECENSGGEWVLVHECPSSCVPPPPTADNCETIEEQACVTVCAEAPNCLCPMEQPFWQDGCVGFEACPSNE